MPVAAPSFSRGFAIVLCLAIVWPQAALPRLEAQSRSSSAQVDLVGFLTSYEGGSPTAQDQVRIVVIEGDGATNNIALSTALDPVVAVLGPINDPIPGALVTFTLPESGPSGLFPNGSRTLTVVTDEIGRAVGEGLVPNQVAGEFDIQITVSVQNLLLGLTQTISHTITQANVRTVAPAEPITDGPTGVSSGRGRLIGILVGVAGAIGVGLAVSGGGSTSTTPPSPPPTTTITPGAISVGAPQ